MILLIDSFIYFYFLFSRVKVERQSGVDYRSLEWHRGGVVLSARGTRCSASAVCPQGEELERVKRICLGMNSPERHLRGRVNT